MARRAVMTVTCASALELSGRGAKKSNSRMSQGQHLKRFCASRKSRMGEVGEHSHDMPCTWRLSWLAVERPWSALAWPFLSLAQVNIVT